MYENVCKCTKRLGAIAANEPSLCSIDLNTPERVRYQSHHTLTHSYTDTERTKYVEENKYGKLSLIKYTDKIDKLVENLAKVLVCL